MSELTTVQFAARFENWKSWCVQKGLHQAKAGSAEGNYKSPQHWEPVGPRPPAIDLLDAVLVNRAYTRLAMIAPYHSKVIQTLVFMGWIKPQRQAQILGTHYLRLDVLLDTAKQMLKNQLRVT